MSDGLGVRLRLPGLEDPVPLQQETGGIRQVGMFSRYILESDKIAVFSGYMRRFWWWSMDHRGVPGAPGRVVNLLPDREDSKVGTVGGWPI